MCSPEQVKEQRSKFNETWVNDIKRLETASTKKARAKRLWADVRQLMKRVPEHPNLGPLSDVIHIVLNVEGLVKAIIKNDYKGIVKSSVAIVGAVVALGLFAIKNVAGPVVGILFYMAGVLIEAIWPKNQVIRTANQLSSYARQELNGFSPELQRLSQKGTQ